MQHPGVKLVTIVCESALERLIARDLIEVIGVQGYTVGDVRGRGARGEQDARLASSSNVRFEVLCEADRAQRAIDMLFAKYSKNYGMVAWMVDVEVARGFNF